MITEEIHAGSKFNDVLQVGDGRIASLVTSFVASDTLVGTVWQGQSQTPLFTFTATWFQSVTEIEVTNGGAGYSASPTITISGGGATDDATAYAVVSGGVITAINLIDLGDGYTGTPSVIITDGTGVGATAEATIVLGWQVGQIAIEIDGTLTASLDPQGTYRAQIVATRDTDSATIIEFLIKIIGAPGLGTQPTLTYCSFQDLKDIAPWIGDVQDVDIDLEGYYSQRLKARLWLDNIVLNKFQSNFVGLYGAHSESAFDFGIGYGWRQSIGPNPTIQDALTANQLLLTPEVVQVCAHYAVGQIGLAQVVSGNQNLVRMGQYHLAKANRDVLAITAQIDTDADGKPNFLANLGTVQTLLG